MASEASRDAPAWLSWAVLAGLAVLLCCLRLHTYHEPLPSEITTYAVIAHELLQGRPLYADLWDLHPPFIFWTYAGAEQVAGYGLRSIFLLNIAASVVTLVGCCFATRSLSGRRCGGLLAAGIWTLIGGDPALWGNQPHAEVFINAALVWGVYFAAEAFRVEPQKQFHALVAAGCCFAIASLYRQATWPVPFLLAVLLATTLFRGQGVRRKFVPFVLFLLPALAAWGAVVAYFTTKGHFPELYQTLVDMNAAYGQNKSIAGPVEWRSLFPVPLYFLLPLLALGVLGVFLAREERGRWSLPGTYLMGTTMVIALSGKYFPHDFLLYVPVVSMATGMGLAEAGRRSLPFQAGLALGVFVWLGWRELPLYQLPADAWSRLKFGSFYQEVRASSTKINALLPPGETLYEYGQESGFYFYTRRKPPSGVINNFTLVDGPYQRQYTRQVIQQLDRTAPEVLILPKGAARGPVTDWAAVRYGPAFQTEHFTVLAKGGGKVETRLARPLQDFHAKP